ncbi:MAG TPA: hypothetical protein VD886_00785 [Herpetosiphonaceae bacterium]|nr:hypothetical protein [Herpetosiphonaceae bacterium]
MFEVPRSVPRGNPWRLALLWMGVAVIGIVVNTLIYPLVFGVFDGVIDNFAVVTSVIFLLVGLLTVTLQWLVLRRFFPGMQRWVPLLGGILLLQMLLQQGMHALVEALLFAAGIARRSGGLIESSALAAGLVVSVFWALVSGIAGGRLFRPSVPRAWRWPAALVAGAAGQTLVTTLVLLPMIRSGVGGNATIYGVVSIATSLLSAALQAAVLALFLREQQRPGAGLPSPIQ